MMISKYLESKNNILYLKSQYNIMKTFKNKKINKSLSKFCVLIHGGAGDISKNIDDKSYYAALESIINNIYKFIKTNSNITAVDICEFAVKLFEDNPLFNAGKGSVSTDKKTYELEAAIMDGKTLKCGSVSLIQRVKNPISVARLVMDKTNHNYIIGEAAENIAKQNGLTMVNNSYFSTGVKTDRIVSDKNSKVGTSGAVCLYKGTLAAATSTGGITNKMSGRVGDTPIIGAGTYANNDTCAVSATGWGEEFMRRVAAYDIAARIKYAGKDLITACHDSVFNYLPSGSGGIIAVDKQGNFSMDHNSSGMFRGIIQNSKNIGYNITAKIGIWDDMIPVELSKTENKAKNPRYLNKTRRHKRIIKGYLASNQ